MKTIHFKTIHNREMRKFVYQFDEKISKAFVKWTVSVNKLRMKSLRKSNLVVVLYFIGVLILCDGCAFTWIGRSVGGDIGRPSFNNPLSSRIVKVAPADINFGRKNQVELHKTDSTILTGKFRGFLSLPLGNFMDKYNQFIDSISSLTCFPKIGKALFVKEWKKSDEDLLDFFEGFYLDGMKMKLGKNVRNLSYKKVLCLSDSNGKEYNLETIPKRLDSCHIHLRTGVLIQTVSAGKIIIPLEEIAYVRCQKGERNGKLIGTAIGALIDLTILFAKTQDNVSGIIGSIDF